MEPACDARKLFHRVERVRVAKAEERLLQLLCRHLARALRRGRRPREPPPAASTSAATAPPATPPAVPCFVRSTVHRDAHGPEAARGRHWKRGISQQIRRIRARCRKRNVQWRPCRPTRRPSCARVCDATMRRRRVSSTQRGVQTARRRSMYVELGVYVLLTRADAGESGACSRLYNVQL